MTDDGLEHLNERDFPNHRLPRDIGLAEYSSAVERLSNNEKALTWATNSAVIIGSAIAYFSLNFSGFASELERRDVRGIDFSVFIITLLLGFLYFSTRHLAELQRSLVFAERKIIVIRRMLGASYGDATLVLPSHRAEGANDPFSIPMFSGYFSISAFPLYVIASTTALAVIFLSGEVYGVVQESSANPRGATGSLGIALGLLSFFLSVAVYRISLFETNENIRLYFARIIARFLRVRLVENFERELYRLRLEIAEMHRIGTKLLDSEAAATFIEDRRFRSHFGVDLRGVIRAIRGLALGVPRGGGSTITQQLARGIFIVRPRNSFRRKFIEILIALWLESRLSKQEILHGYLATARFDNGVYGVHRACRDFFASSPQEITKPEAFVLIERLGNIKGKLLGRRVKDLLSQAIEQGVLGRPEALVVLGLYEFMLQFRITQADGHPSPREVRDSLKLEIEA